MKTLVPTLVAASTAAVLALAPTAGAAAAGGQTDLTLASAAAKALTKAGVKVTPVGTTAAADARPMRERCGFRRTIQRYPARRSVNRRVGVCFENRRNPSRPGRNVIGDRRSRGRYGWLHDR